MPVITENPPASREGVKRKTLLVKDLVSPESFDLQDTQLFLDTLFERNNTPTRQEYRKAVGFLGQPQILSSVLSSILHDPEQLQAISARSFHHSNGMERINLLTTPKYELRMHIWWQGKKEGATEDPHDHIYDFASTVVAGALANDIFVRSTEGLPVDAFGITTQKALSQPTVTHNGVARLLPLSPVNGFIATDRMAPYTMGRSAIHQLRPIPDQTVITLNLRGTGVKERSSFFTFPNADHPTPTTSPLDIAESLSRTLKIISPATGRKVVSA